MTRATKRLRSETSSKQPSEMKPNDEPKSQEEASSEARTEGAGADVADKKHQKKKAKTFILSGMYSNDYKIGSADFTTSSDNTDSKMGKAGSAEPVRDMRTRVREAARAAKELHKQPAPRGGIKTRSCAQKPEKGPALPFPIHWGEHLLQRRADFLLPEYFLEEEEAVRARLDAKAKPEPYREIPRNQYTSRRKLQANAAVCQCKPDSRCRDECMNRLMQYICDPKTCPCGENCTNQRLGVRVPPKCEVVKCGKRGFGLKTKEPLKKGQLVDEYRGEIIDLPEATRRTVNIYKEKGNFYLLDYDAAAGEVLDSGMKGNRTRFANHSCDPNCHMQKWIICGTGEQLKAEFEIGLFASRDIEAGEELTYDYGWSMFVTRSMDGEVTDKGTPITCHCGSENCSGVLGGKKALKPSAVEDKKKSSKKSKKKRKSSASRASHLLDKAVKLSAGVLNDAAKSISAAVAKIGGKASQRAHAMKTVQTLGRDKTERKVGRSARVDKWQAGLPPGVPLSSSSLHEGDISISSDSEKQLREPNLPSPKAVACPPSRKRPSTADPDKAAAAPKKQLRPAARLPEKRVGIARRATSPLTSPEKEISPLVRKKAFSIVLDDDVDDETGSDAPRSSHSSGLRTSVASTSSTSGRGASSRTSYTPESRTSNSPSSPGIFGAKVSMRARSSLRSARDSLVRQKRQSKVLQLLRSSQRSLLS